MDGKSLDITTERLQQLQAIFPEAFTEEKVDFERLKAALGEDIAPAGEHYELSWAGKGEARKQIQKQTTHTLLPDRESSINFDQTENIFIEGENLEVLHVLQRSYFGKVKMIYIDPPYNTGNDSFVYPDDYTERQAEYKQRAGITDDQGYLNKQDLWRKNSRESGQFHSVWLSMMYPRLYLARNLMREDGVIFVSIDDNEQANLKLLMDEIFGEENFVATIIWQKKYAVSNDDPGIAAMHDYIICYQKSSMFSRNLLPRTEKQISRYKNIDNDPRGVWSSAEYVSSKSKEERPTLWYPIIHPKTGKEVWPDPSAVWRYSKEKHEVMVKENRLYWGPNNSYEKPRLKRFLSEIQEGLVPSTWWSFEDVGHNDEGQKETAELLGKKVFSTPKPVRLLKRILQISTSAEDLVLDFFGGSGSTAHAVLDLNKADGGNRKFICVQLPEATEENSEAYKAGYRTIADITKARIKKVIEQQQAKQAGELDFAPEQAPIGFQAYKLAPSNFKQWRTDVEGPEAILNQLEMFATGNATEQARQENMLTELLLKSGKPLTTPAETVTTPEGSFYYLPAYQTCLCLQSFGPGTREELHRLAPREVVALNTLFTSDELLTNTKLELEEAGIRFTLV